MTGLRDIQREHFAQLMERYAAVKQQHTALTEERRKLQGEMDSLREAMRIEAQNLGLVRGTRLKFGDVGTFSFQKKTYYSVPKARRGDFARLLASRQEHDLLTINATDLADWCEDIRSLGGAVPDYVSITTDEFVPHVTLARRGPAAPADE